MPKLTESTASFKCNRPVTMQSLTRNNCFMRKIGSAPSSFYCNYSTTESGIFPLQTYYITATKCFLHTKQMLFLHRSLHVQRFRPPFKNLIPLNIFQHELYKEQDFRLSSSIIVWYRSVCSFVISKSHIG